MNPFKAQSASTRVGKYELGQTLGAGTFAKVKYARNVETGEPVAIKIIEKEKLLKRKMVNREIATMKLIKHPNVVQLIEVLASKKKIYIVLEYIDGEELFDKIVDEGILKEQEARRYFQQLIHGVDYCHSRGVYHRDLKPENLIIDSRGDLKISDFGLSALSQQRWEDGLLHTTCGTPNYVAPEIINGNGYDGAPADLWSCGIILYVLLAGYLPFDEPNIITLYQKMNQADFTFPSWLSAGARKLITRLLDPNQKTRLTIAEILEDEWFKIGDNAVNCSDKGNTFEDVDANSDIREVNFEIQDSFKEETRPALINAFALISMSPGLNLSGLFEEKKSLLKGETRFTSKHPANDILSNIQDVANSLGFRVKKKDYKMKMQSATPGRKGLVSVATEVFEMGPSLFMVDLKKTNGDTLEYNEFNKNLRAGLKDIVWKTEEDMACI